MTTALPLQLGRLRDTVLGRLHGVPRTTVASRRAGLQIPTVSARVYRAILRDVDLGVISDAAMGRKHRTSRYVARRVRVALGIEAKAARGGEHRGIRWELQPLGREPDRRIARRLGCASSSVTRARQRRGIAPVNGPSSAAPS